MRSDQPTHQPQPWFIRILPMVSLFAGITLTATGEYEMAVAAHVPLFAAPAYPICLDAYALAAIWNGRRGDVAGALGLMMISTLLAHLHAAGDISSHRPLVVAICVIAPIVVWRVKVLAHAIAESRAPAPVEQAAPVYIPPVPAPVAVPVAAPAPVAPAEPVAPVVPDSPAALDGLAAPVEEPVRFPYGVAPTGIHQEDVWDVVVPLHRKHPRLSAPELKERFNLRPSIRTIQRVVKAAKERDNVLIAV